MARAIPPGVVYLRDRLPWLFWPSVTLYIAFRWSNEAFNVRIPAWTQLVTILLARPFLSLLQYKYKDYRDVQEAKRLGAVLAPILPPSSFTVIKAVLEAIETGFPGDIVDSWTQQFGNTFYFNKFTSRSLLTVEPDLVKAVLATQFKAFVKGEEFVGQMESLLGNGIFNVDGDMWRFHRAMARPFFRRERIRDFDIFDRNANLSFQLATERIRQGEPFDFQDLVGRFTLDAITEFLLGHSVKSLEAGLPYPLYSPYKSPPSHPLNTFVVAFTEGQREVNKRGALGMEWPLREFFKDTVEPLRKVMDNFMEPLMEEAIARWKQDQNGDTFDEKEDDSLLAHLVRCTQDPKILKDELVNLLVAGRDTTASLITFSLYMLTQHPDVEERLREEILDEVGPTAAPTYTSMREMKYMKAFLNEVLRLYPPVPFDTRHSNRSVVIPAKHPGEMPLYIPANTSILYSVIVIQRRKDLWGPDALEFDPERFIDSRFAKYLKPNPFIFCPFNAGPRICIGQQFAYHEATLYLVRLLQRFRNFRLDDRHNVKPPSAWKASTEGTKSREKVHPLANITMFVKFMESRREDFGSIWTSWILDENENLYYLTALASLSEDLSERKIKVLQSAGNVCGPVA